MVYFILFYYIIYIYIYFLFFFFFFFFVNIDSQATIYNEIVSPMIKEVFFILIIIKLNIFFILNEIFMLIILFIVYFLLNFNEGLGGI